MLLHAALFFGALSVATAAGVSYGTALHHAVSGRVVGRVEIQLSNVDSGRSVTAHVCDWIEVELTGSTSAPWQTDQSSDESVLAIVPLPLPAQPPGGTGEIFEAKRTGRATLSCGTALTWCVACPAQRWLVTVSVAGGR